MSSRTSWLLALAACVACLDAGASAQGPERIPPVPQRIPLRILVVQPKTERLVHFADVSVLTKDTPPVCIRQGSTGRTGEPFEAEAEESLDPALREVVVIAKRGDITGTMRLSYDPRLGAWQQPDRYEFDAAAGDWRHLVFDAATGDWQLFMYDYAAERWRLDGTYKYFAPRDEWWLWWFDYEAGKWWQRNLYEKEPILGRAEPRWKLTKFRDSMTGELASADRDDQEHWRLPANDSGPQLVRLRMTQAHVIPVRHYSSLLPAAE